MWNKIQKIYIWTNLVRPSTWQPWANTIAYYPLNSTTTVNDMSWNWHTLTATGMTYGTNYAIFPNNNSWWSYYSVTDLTFPSTFFIGCWCLRTSTTWNRVITPALWYVLTSRYCVIAITTNILITYTGSSDYGVSLPTDMNTDEWYYTYYTWTLSWSVTSWFIYPDWTHFSDTRTSSVPSSRPWTSWVIWTNWHPNYRSGDSWRWYMSDLIIEDKVWTQQDIEDYYNGTKANYWL